MKKIIYNKFMKLLVMLLTLVCAGMLLYNAIKITDKYADYSGYTDAIYGDNAYMSNYIRELISKDVGEILNDVVLRYLAEGMSGVENYVNDCNSEYGDIFNVMIADENSIYSSFPDVDVTGVTDTIEFVRNVIYSEYVSKQGNSQLWLTPDTGNVFRWYYTEWIKEQENEFLSADALTELAKIDYKLSVKVCLTPDYVNGELFWGNVDGCANKLYEQKALELEAVVSAYIMDIVIWATAFLATVVISILICGRTPEGLKVLNRLERAGTEIYIAIIAAGFAGMFVLLNVLMEMNDYYYVYYVYGEPIFEWLGNAYIGILAAAVGIVTVCYIAGGIIVKKLKNRCLIKDFYTIRIICRIKKMLVKAWNTFKSFCEDKHEKSTFAKLDEIKKLYIKKTISDIFVGIIIVITISSIAFFDGDMWTLSYFMYMLAWILMVLYFRRSFKEYRYLKEYNRVASAVSVIAGGDYNGIAVAENEKNDTMLKLANMSNSFMESVRKQVESEKMQIELVANVSRDLKAPLNSIVNYVELLKEEKMSDVAKDYVRVIVDKSKRLNDIVSDVFDLAKATNGEDVEMEQLDGVMLLKQVLSDMDDRIKEAGKDLRVSIPAESAPIRGNGQKLYRVFQNVIDNALKYSMPGTRIYLAAEKLDKIFYVTIKNISEYEMEFTEEEIMSRFTRGDKARHSEGNGLGLSIAKSFTELCGGTFDVKIDDDVFMVTIRLS